MVGRIIPVAKTDEDDKSVTYTWGFAGAERVAVIDKATRTITPGEGTTDGEAEFLLEWIGKVRQLNEMAGYPDEAPIYQ